MTYYRRRELGRQDKIVSALVAAGAAAATAVVVGYISRLFLARERLSGPPGFGTSDADGDVGEGGHEGEGEPE